MIAKEVRERTPLITARGADLRKRLLEHSDAPRWTYAAGDRLVKPDVPVLERFREDLNRDRRLASIGLPPPAVVAQIAANRLRVPWLRRHLPAGGRLADAWPTLPTTRRADLAAAPWEFVPDDIDLGRLLIYRTAGTTGHPISTPHHPSAIACYPALLEFACARHGVRLEPRPDAAGCFLVSSQIRTYTYATVLTAWRGAGFAKLNLRGTEWKRGDSPHRYIAAFAPPLVTGDPIAFAELIRLGIPVRPAAMVSTSAALSPAARKRFADHFGCPVVDWYSLVETGPIAYGCPAGRGWHLLPPDIHVEILRPDGTAAATGERGEIAVTGGRNPYLPLFRYRTGDTARHEEGPCGCGDPAPRLAGLEGRPPVLFRAADGTPISTVDLARVLREFPLLQHAFTQRADRSCEARLRALPGAARPRIPAVRAALRGILGRLPVDVRFDPHLGDDAKAPAWKSELAP